MHGIAEAMAGAGLHVEVPRLPGHGTDVEDMLPTRWADWTGEVAAAFERLSARTGRIVVVGQSMGGSLALWIALHEPLIRGLVLINPLTEPQPADVREMIGDLLATGTDVAPGIGSDIAEPGVTEIAYPGTPLAPLISLLDDGLVPLTGRYGELTMPLLLFTSRQDHVVEPRQSEHLAERTAARSSTAGWSAAITWRPRTTTATRSSPRPSTSPCATPRCRGECEDR